MPHLRIETNVSKDAVPKELPQELSKLIAKLLGKPESYCCVTIVPDQLMVFGGTDEPCGQAWLMSIGQLGKKENMAHSKGIFEKLSKSLGIPPTRMYITFQDAEAMNVGYNGTTFAEIFGK
ncbi:macrophage migration inhibitory factor-like [Bradysia coprophila]|uniref:macrophage migration inhibitory factor-like n=1 Tax=Bradysia coprophila TaxID=38358 RepID=UPI00187DBA95|nr:macrophage migration inhibitory factor-like [Bradysia coprophila]